MGRTIADLPAEQIDACPRKINGKGQILLLYIEPTPYITPLVLALKQLLPGLCDVAYLTRNNSQSWAEDGETVDDAVVISPPGASWCAGVSRLTGLLLGIVRRQYCFVHLAGWGHPILMTAILLCRLRHVPFSLESDTQYKGDGFFLKAIVKRLAYPRIFGWAAVLFPGGQRQANLFQRYRVPDSKIRIAYMTTDIERIGALPAIPRTEWLEQHAVDRHRPVFLYVGRLEPYKGLATLQVAYEEFLCRAPAAVLVIVGDGTLLDPIRAWAAARPAGTVLVCGRCSAATVYQWMKSSDVLVLPSYSDQWGLVVNEALACGLPVIASQAVGATTDLVFCGRNGYVVPTGDSHALAEAMELATRDEGHRREMSRAATEIIAPWTIRREAQVLAAGICSVLQP